jgi:carboxyl-terminal processing protease
VDGVVLDLRRNGGGLLTEALSLTGLFIDQGPVVQVKDSRERLQQMDDPERGTAYSGPLMVLVSRFSASASEILAGALQDYGRAVVVGDTATHGKGTVQAVLDIGSQLRADPPPKLGALKLTIQQFYRVNGDSTQSRGVVSDVVLPSFTEHLGTAEKDMEHALPFDKVKAANHDNLGLVSAELKTRASSQARQGVGGLREDGEGDRAVQARKARKAVTLNEKELREQLAREDADKLDEKANGLPKETATDGDVFKFSGTS